MNRCSLAGIYTLPLLLAWNVASKADTLSWVSLQGSVASPITSCSASDAAAASCTINFTAGSGYDEGQGFGLASASSAFGSLSGSADLFGSPDLLGRPYPTVSGEFSADFNDPVLITGGTGSGTVVAHFSWSDAEYIYPVVCNDCYPGGFWPSFSADIGGTSQSWSAGPTSSTTGTFDLAASFVFGSTTSVGGSLSADPTTELLVYSGSGSDAGASASLTLTGFSVYDSAGNLVPGAEVTPMLSPEPGAWSLCLAGLLILVGLRRVRRPKTDTVRI